jgi:ribose transport system substrate-binding protein/inositol transport system substrate-binding protein
MKTFKLIVVMLLALALMFSMLAGCSEKKTDDGAATETTAAETSAAASEAAEPSAEAPSNDSLKIGYSVYWLSEFATLMTDAMQEKADAEGVELLVRDANWDASKQLGHVEEFITQGVDAMIIAAVDATSMQQGVAMADDAGIPFIGVNMYVEAEGVDAYSGPNDVRAGEMMVEYCIDKLGTSFNCIVLEGAEGYFAMLDRREGIKNMTDANTGINVLAIKTANWTREGALELMENYIQEFGDEIQAVVCHNDEMALGAIQALEAAGMNDKVIVTGVDAIYDGCKAIKDGRYEYTVFQDATLEGGLAFEKALALAKGETLEEKETFIDMVGVTADNVDEYLANFEK